MLYRLMADLVVVTHVAFLVFVGGGSLLARRRPWVAWLHVSSLTWAVASITIGIPCPLTALEKLFRRLADEGAYGGGFVDHYIEGVVYPASLTPLLHAMAFIAIVIGYRSLYRRQCLAGRVTQGLTAATRTNPMAVRRHSKKVSRMRRVRDRNASTSGSFRFSMAHSSTDRMSDHS